MLVELHGLCVYYLGKANLWLAPKAPRIGPQVGLLVKILENTKTLENLEMKTFVKHLENLKNNLKTFQNAKNIQKIQNHPSHLTFTCNKHPLTINYSAPSTFGKAIGNKYSKLKV